MLELPEKLLATAAATEHSLDSNESTWQLSHLEVFNWGPFRGLHRAEFDAEGTAIIGPTGSGKTTLVDALMTLLVHQPRYNLASTGGHESDRTLISYVRGVLGGDGSEGREEVARPGKTITGICATYRAGTELLRLAGLLWTEGTSNAADDLKRRWLFSLAENQSLEKWLRLLHEDGVRDLMKMGRETPKLRIFDSKSAYLVHTRKFFDVGDNAFTLLNRAAGLKQLNSIDDIFRELVLDDRSAFDRALEVATEFDTLVAIHAELELARRQQESLTPVATEYQHLTKAQHRVERLRLLKQLLPIWFAIAGKDRWQCELDRISARREELDSQLHIQLEQEKMVGSKVDILRERYLELGGSVISELERTILIQKERVAEKAKRAAEYRRMAEMFNLDAELSQRALDRNQTELREKRPEAQRQRDDQQEQVLVVLSQQREQEAKLATIESDLRRVAERPGSNIPPQFQDFRADLAATLALMESELPFLAELIEVRTDEARWRGAIERAVGSERLRILVPDESLNAALSWVNNRDNRLHVRLQGARHDEEPVSFFPDGFTRKLNFKKHPLISMAKRLLAGRDLHCVASPEALRTTEHALTVEGTISGRGSRFEKQDQRPLNADWMTGFDNKDQLDSLKCDLESTRNTIDLLKTHTDAHRRRLALLDEHLAIIDGLITLEFSAIDLEGAESELSGSLDRLAALLNPLSDACQAKAVFESEHAQLDMIRGQLRKLESEIAVFDSHTTQAREEFEKCVRRAGNGLAQEEVPIAEKHLVINPGVAAKELNDAERDAAEILHRKLADQTDKVTEIEQRLVRLMEIARRVDTGALAETTSDIDNVPFFLERLRVLNEEALPEKRRRFLEYLNRSSDQGVTQLLKRIEEEVDAIEQRIAELNQTLVRVNFRSGRYLQLMPQRIKDERLRALDTAMRKVRSAALKDDEGESHYRALQEMVKILRDAGENRRQQSAKALLDPRFRLQFFVIEANRHTGDRSLPRSGSQSGSGGEKELMASHILTASLSYALCPQGANRPLYGTVVLDEAFSKSSPSAASRIIEALRIFCLHPIFVTPNKEIGLLKEHTRRVICVQRLGKEASLASITWEKLEELARQQ